MVLEIVLVNEGMKWKVFFFRGLDLIGSLKEN